MGDVSWADRANRYLDEEDARLATREVMRDALGAVYAGAGDLEVDALLDQMADRGLRVIR